MSKHAEFADAFRKSTLQKWALDTEKVDRLESKIEELKARLADAHDLVDAYSAYVDGYYIPSGKSVISEHDEYVQKWGDWE